MKVILAAWSLGLQAGARGVELPEKKVSGGEREFSYSFVTFKPEVDLHSPLFYVVGTMYYIVCTTYIVCSRGLRRARLLPCEKWVNMGGTREQLAATTMRDFATSGQLVLDWMRFKFLFCSTWGLNVKACGVQYFPIIAIQTCLVTLCCFVHQTRGTSWWQGTHSFNS